MTDIGTYLDVVEIRDIDNARNTNAPAVPCYMEPRILLMDILRQLIDELRFGIAAHKGNTGNVISILGNEIVNRASI